MSNTFPNVKLVGTHFRPQAAKDFVSMMSEGTILTCVRDTENEYDANAIQLHYRDLFLGFIEKEQAAWIAPELDEDPSVEWQAEVTGFHSGARVTYPVVTVSPVLP